eukprot:CAMPEP_0119262222 /NCGR_PEP_ID=MMETSP1329-20130426/2021_1 /TAXON_ID=114041 /ORGANISM="Genus nov. species nov., Strain RCC1024" /LENGTH=129 /DNA_ID=CAMNT_0007261849 /DNA_START=103 /DNA_END=492 /DNA_ORIENTATION=+
MAYQAKDVEQGAAVTVTEPRLKKNFNPPRSTTLMRALGLAALFAVGVVVNSSSTGVVHQESIPFGAQAYNTYLAHHNGDNKYPMVQPGTSATTVQLQGTSATTVQLKPGTSATTVQLQATADTAGHNVQ